MDTYAGRQTNVAVSDQLRQLAPVRVFDRELQRFALRLESERREQLQVPQSLRQVVRVLDESSGVWAVVAAPIEPRHRARAKLRDEHVRDLACAVHLQREVERAALHLVEEARPRAKVKLAIGKRRMPRK